MTIKFVQRVLQVNANGRNKIDGMHAMKIFLALLENLDCTNYLPDIVGILLAELHMAANNKKTPKEYTMSII